MAPTMLSPASPSELLHYIVTYHTYPTTLLICSPQEDFMSSLVSEIKIQVGEETDTESPDDEPPAHPLLAAPLFQEAIARHIRVLFIPSVAHMRAHLAVFSPAVSKVPPPPNLPPLPSSAKHRQPLLAIYGFLDLHRDSSEWSAQGIGCSAALLVDAAQRTDFKPAIIEPRAAGGHQDFRALLRDVAPVLSGSLRRDEGGWTGRTIEVRRVLARWFCFQSGQWDIHWGGQAPPRKSETSPARIRPA